MEDIGDIGDLSLTGQLAVYSNLASQVLYLKAHDMFRLESYAIVDVLGQTVQTDTLAGKPA